MGTILTYTIDYNYDMFELELSLSSVIHVNDDKEPLLNQGNHLAYTNLVPAIVGSHL